MKTHRAVAFIPLLALALAAGCGSAKKSSTEIAATGPTVLNVRAIPETAKLDDDMRPEEPVEIRADVKDFKSNVTRVRLRFVHTPLELSMRNIGGSTWAVELTQENLRMLAVSGQTIRYEANVIATNAEGQVAVSREPVELAVKTQEIRARG